MKQVLLGKRIHVTDVPAPGLESGCVLVETCYSFISSGTEAAPVIKAQANLVSKSINRARQIPQVMESIRVNGIKKTMMRVNEHLDKRLGRLGYSSSGRVIEVGRNVHDMSPGDLVACAGMGHAVHAEVVSVPRNLVAKVPDGCDLKAACGTTIAAIALQGIRRAGLQIGESAAVFGLGLLGRITMQLLQASGVDTIGFDPDQGRVDAATKAGHGHCYPLTGSAAVKKIQLSFPQGVDATIVTAATTDTSVCQSAIEATRKKGRVVVVGAVPLQFDREPFYRKEIDFLISCSYGPGRYDPSYESDGHDYPYSFVRWTENRNMQAVLKLLLSGQLDLLSLIEQEYSIENAEQAFTALTGTDSPRPLGIVLNYSSASARTCQKFAKIQQLKAPRDSNKSKISLGVIGIGQFFTKTLLPNLVDLSDQYRLHAICNRTGSTAQDLARRHKAPLATTDPHALLADPEVDAVIISTRHDSHAFLASAALDAGKHVFLEKPLAMNHAELEQVIQAHARSDKHLMVGFNRRFSPHVERIQDVLQRRTTPLNIVYRVIADPVASDGWLYSEAGGGRVIGEACHMLDLFGCLVGVDREVTELDVMCSASSRLLAPGDNFSVSLRYDDDSLCTLVYSVLGRKSESIGKERVELLWDRETFVIDNFLTSYGTLQELKPFKANNKGHHGELARFAHHILRGEPEPIPLQSLVATTELSFKIDSICRNLGISEEGDVCHSQSI